VTGTLFSFKHYNRLLPNPLLKGEGIGDEVCGYPVYSTNQTSEIFEISEV